MNGSASGVRNVERERDYDNRNMSPLIPPKAQESITYQTGESNSYISRSPLNVSSNNYQAFNSR